MNERTNERWLSIYVPSRLRPLFYSGKKKGRRDEGGGGSGTIDAIDVLKNSILATCNWTAGGSTHEREYKGRRREGEGMSEAVESG